MHCNESLWLSAPLSKLKAGTFLNLNTVVCDLSCCSLGQPSSLTSQSRRGGEKPRVPKTPRPAISTRPAPAPARACAHGRSDEVTEPGGGGMDGEAGVKKGQVPNDFQCCRAGTQAAAPHVPAHRPGARARCGEERSGRTNSSRFQGAHFTADLPVQMAKGCSRPSVGILAYSVIVLPLEILNGLQCRIFCA